MLCNNDFFYNTNCLSLGCMRRRSCATSWGPTWKWPRTKILRQKWNGGNFSKMSMWKGRSQTIPSPSTSRRGFRRPTCFSRRKAFTRNREGFFSFFLLLGCVCVLSFCLTFVIVLLFFFFINCLRFLSFPFSFSLISPPQHVFRRNKTCLGRFQDCGRGKN